MKEGAKKICHGVMEWEVYEEWRGRERGKPPKSNSADDAAANYPADAFPFLAQLIPPDVYNLILTPLFHLFSRFVAHSHLSGLTPHALSSLFAPLLFDSPTSTTALTSHAVFVRSACATEHLLLACIRSSDTIGTLVTDLPFRLKEWVAGYPSMVVPDADLARGAPRRGARIIRCERASRTVRAYTKDLLPHVEGWVGEVPDGEKWEAWEGITWKARRGSVARPKPSSAWKRRLAVKNIPTPPTHPSDLSRSVSYGAALRPASIMSGVSGMGIKGREEEEEARYGSLAGKEWSMFEEGGFDAPTEETREDIDTRLQFDLNESAKLVSGCYHLSREAPLLITSFDHRALQKNVKQWTGTNSQPLQVVSSVLIPSWTSPSPFLPRYHQLSHPGQRNATNLPNVSIKPKRTPFHSITTLYPSLGGMYLFLTMMTG